MSIENIQKKRFLETIMKIYYCLGSEPNSNDISVLFGQYFNVNRIGDPVTLRYDDLNFSDTIDYEKLNRIMATLLFNTDVLYESFYEEVEQLYSVISSYKFRLDNLKNKRAEVEKKVDDHLFALKNTDGFYYSVSNAFNDTNSTDLDNTSAFVDTEIRKVSLPKLSSDLFNYVANILNNSVTVELTIVFDGEVKESRGGVNFGNVFSGLNNDPWTYQATDGSFGYKSNTIGLCTLKITVPVSTAVNNSVSVIEGRLRSKKAVDISVVISDAQDRSNSILASKSGLLDYDVFSFHFDPKPVGFIDIYLTKAEPDYVNTDSSQNKIYVYDFTIDDLVITAPYYDFSARYISNPISIPSDQNTSLMIDAVMLETNDQIPNGCNINYYVAVDNNSPNVELLNWYSISPSNYPISSNEKVINFNGAALRAKKIIESSGESILPTDNDLVKVPRATTWRNPIESYFYQNDYNNIGFSLYRLCKMPAGVNPIETYILENVDQNQLRVSFVSGTSLSQSVWQDVLAGKRNDLVLSQSNMSVPDSQDFLRANFQYGSIHVSTNIFSDSDVSITKNVLKTIYENGLGGSQYWDVEIYLNGRLLSRVEPGVLKSSVTWNFKKGQNSLAIVINNSTNHTNGVNSSFNGSLSLFEGISIKNIPSIKVYQNYLYQVKIEDLRNLYSNADNVFSIINWEGNKEIVYRREKEIDSGSIVYYYENLNNGITSLRLRADLFRGQNAFASPSINSYRLKFKH